MMIVAEAQSDSLRRADVMVKKFESLELVQFKGENVRDYAKVAHSLLIQLERDDQLPRTHLITIVDALSACSVMGGFPLYAGGLTYVGRCLQAITARIE